MRTMQSSGLQVMHLILDTNIYGLLAVDKDLHTLHAILESKPFRIYGLDIIRRELKSAPRVIVKNVNIHASLLRAYSEHLSKEYSFEERFAELARAYYVSYCENGGSLPQETLFNDFLIVACASVKNIDIVVSEDKATMLGELQRRSYQQVNALQHIRMPRFIGYKEFKSSLLRTGSSNPVVYHSDKFRVFLSLFNLFPRVFCLSFHTLNEEGHIFKGYAPVFTFCALMLRMRVFWHLRVT